MDTNYNAKKNSIRGTEVVNISESDSDLLGCAGSREEGDEIKSERRGGAINKEESDTTPEVLSYEGAIQFIGGICSRLDQQDERLLEYARQHNNRLKERKQESDNFIAIFQAEQKEIKAETQQLLALLKSQVKE